jgi:hypothetical protein
MALIGIRFQLAYVGADELVERRRQLLMAGERDESLGKRWHALCVEHWDDVLVHVGVERRPDRREAA